MAAQKRLSSHIHLLFFLLLLFFNFLKLNAQHITTHSNMLWFNYNNQIVFNDKWQVASDIQLRTRNWVDKWSQFALRTGVTYKISKKISVSAGFAWFGTARYINDNTVIPNEWRPWQEIAYAINVNKINFSQRLRLEQRFFQQIVNGKKTSAYSERTRLRYRFEFGFPLKENKIDAAAGNEVMINPGHFGDSLLFDQNRLFFLINFQISKTAFFQFQFIKLHQWQAAVNTLDNQNVFRFSIHQRFGAGKAKR